MRQRGRPSLTMFPEDELVFPFSQIFLSLSSKSQKLFIALMQLLDAVDDTGYVFERLQTASDGALQLLVFCISATGLWLGRISIFRICLHKELAFRKKVDARRKTNAASSIGAHCPMFHSIVRIAALVYFTIGFRAAPGFILKIPTFSTLGQVKSTTAWKQKTSPQLSG